MPERWARCAGFPDYEISTDGHVRQRHTLRRISPFENDQGYLYVNVQRAGKRFKARVHCLVWKSFRGRVPPSRTVDHKNRVRNDARLTNLRLLGPSMQQANQGSLRGAVQYKGVTWCKARGRFMAQIKQHGVNYFLGRFRSQRKAGLAYDRAARRLFGKFAVTNFKGKSHV